MTSEAWTEIKRKTRETEVELKLRLRGSGWVELKVELFFLRHMLEAFALHGGFDLQLQATGEDQHHLVEDVGIALGRAIREAVPDLTVKRYAHAIVPMDDALVLVAIDLVDRPYAAVELPNALYRHMLRSMTLDGRFTLHVCPLAGEDPHHVVEAAFKGLGRALGSAIQPLDRIASAKGEVTWS